MTERHPDDVTLYTLHDDLTVGFADLKAELRSGFTDLKTTVIAGFRSLPTRESSEEMVRLLRERSRQLDIHVCDQHPETQAIRRALAERKRRLAEALGQLIEARRRLSVAQRRMIDALRRRDNGNSDHAA
jgi:hypothetical protein